jgi:aspartate kinase
MRVFKFGGASVQDAGAIKNVSEILQKYGTGELVVVISAIGKTTNALEDILNSYWEGLPWQPKINALKKHHFDIMDGLFLEKNKDLYDTYDNIENDFISLEHFFEKKLERNYDFIYDQVISYGELLSTKIVSAYLNYAGYRNKWLDARNFVITDQLYREARIQLDTTTALITRRIPEMIKTAPVITQGFIAGTKDNHTTTLGREGSDYTASIFAHALDAEAVVIWKDVPGILNADPKIFPDAVKFEQLSYTEAIEMTYYGASVLHPKTIKPIQNKNIPLHVNSFKHPELEGTIIQNGVPVRTDVPIIILKSKQLQLSLQTRDFSFIAEENIKTIFEEVVNHGIKVNVMSNSAISFLICIDEMPQKMEKFITALEKEFFITIESGLELLSIKHYKENMLSGLLKNKEVVGEHKSGDAVQFIIREVK